MLWILVDVALVLGSLAILAVLALGLWRRVKALGGAVARIESLVSPADLQVARRPEPVQRRPEVQRSPGRSGATG